MLFALVLASSAPPTIMPVDTAPSSRQVRTDAQSLLRLGLEVEQAGRTGQAETIYEALLADPEPAVRKAARFRLAVMAREAGQTSEAALHLRRLLDDDPGFLEARLGLASMLVEIGDEDAALRELRAAQAAGLPPQIARMVDRMTDGLRARQPFLGRFEFAFAPDSNVNGATRLDTLDTVIGDFSITEESKERSGIGVALRGNVQAQVGLGGSARLVGTAATSANLYRKSDFSNYALDMGAGPRLQLGRTRLALEGGLGRQWLGGEPVRDYWRIGVMGQHPLSRTLHGGLGASLVGVDNKRNALEDGKRYGLNASLEKALNPVTGIGLSLGGERAALADPGYSNWSWQARAFAWRDWGRTTLTASMSLSGLVTDERLSLFPDKRRDKGRRVELGAVFRQLDLFGMAPFVRVSNDRNASTIAFYDYRRTRAEFGLARAF
ncbi:tetratricopeptide repeat protein [Sphingomicrobium nitratireducens]|uniref:surface lipoprotein assembly modifier n=1 Tax=Sphingomicrobium nitratireducens TaxID=2964666 RepID=UPI0022407A7B|nr:tetratricopeptide repeat protein [Sphingomicrobium nitratireducens]